MASENKKTHTHTHTQKKYTRQQQKMYILGLFTMAKEGGGGSREGGTGRGWGEESLIFSGEPLCASDVITQHHQEGFSVLFEHFLLQTEEDFCTDNLFSCLIEELC